MTEPKVETIEVPAVKPADLDALISRIEVRIETYEKKYTDAAPNSKLKSVYLTTLEGLQAQLVNAMTPPTQSSPSTPANSESLHSKNISEALRRVKIFIGQDLEKTTQFLDQLQQIFDIEVTRPDPDGSHDLEGIFMRKVLSSVIENRVYKHIEAAGKIDEVSKWDGFKTYVTQHFTPKQNAVQVTCKLYDISWDRSKSETLHVPAQKIAEKVKNGWSALNRQWKEKKGVTTDIPGEDVFQFFGACHLSELIKEHEFDTHRDMIRDLDEVFSVSDVANKAEYYRVRLKDKSGVNVMHAKNQSRPSFKPKNGYGNRDNRRNRSKDKSEVSEEKPETQQEGKKSKPKRPQDSDDESEPKNSSVRYVDPIDWTSRSYHMSISTSKPTSAAKKGSTLTLEPGINGRKRDAKPKKSSSRRSRAKTGQKCDPFRKGKPPTKTVASVFPIHSANGEGQGGNPYRTKYEWVDPDHPHTCWTCEELRADCVCDKSPATLDPDPTVKPRSSSLAAVPFDPPTLFRTADGWCAK